MAILHGGWLVQGSLFIWGELWRRPLAIDVCQSESLPFSPLSLSVSELTEFLHQQAHPVLSADSAIATHQQIVALPTLLTGTIVTPQHSATVQPESDQSSLCLHPWQVEGLCLSPLQAIAFLQSLPLSSVNSEDSFVGPDLRFWAHIARWSLDLLARAKFLPILERQGDGSVQAGWRPLLDSATDRNRLERFAEQMPAVCRLYQTKSPEHLPDSHPITTPWVLDLPVEPDKLIRAFLTQTIDARVRLAAADRTLPTAPTGRRGSETPLEPLLQALGSAPKTILAEPTAIERLEQVFHQWTAPLRQYLAEQVQFRTCFYLHPPASGKTDWKLEYFLQAADNSDFLIDALTVWNCPAEQLLYRGRTVDRPQETLLAGLGLASRLYPVLEPSLHSQRPQQSELTALQVYEFVKTVAWRLQDSGFGVILPVGLANQEGWASRLGLKIQAATPRGRKDQRLGLQSLLTFKWELSIGGQTLSKAEFDRLVALNTPFVEINGEWVELRPQDIRAAQNFFATRKDQMSLSLEDALRISTGDTQLIEKLPVVSFEASGALEELIGALTTGNHTVAALDPPTSFRGQLRPYQARGVGWLAFLERWGLGACLADDMGLGKCVAPDTLIWVNGSWQTAASIWQQAATAAVFDGEGFWSQPDRLLWVNALNQATGEITVAPVRSLYRQQVRETLRKITLTNGNQITITRRHQLLTDRGWTNRLQPGDRVGVPAKLIGLTQDHAPAGLQCSEPGPHRSPGSTAALAVMECPQRTGPEVIYASIESIELIDYVGWVYDLEVATHHNFVANQILCHNTIQFIAFLLHLKEQAALSNPTLLVCPTSVLGNWEREVRKFGPSLKLLVYHGDKRPKGKALTKALQGKDLMITSYALVQRDLKDLQGLSWQGIVLDEAQNIKNAESKQSQAVRQLQSQFRIALTGTPVENRLSELWSILDFLNPNYLGPRNFFQRRFAVPIEKYGDTASLQSLRALVQPFILRRLKTDRAIIQDLPEKQEMTIFCGLSAEQAALYQQTVDCTLVEIESAEGIQRRGMILALLVKLKQICNHPAQYLKEGGEKKKSAAIPDLEVFRTRSGKLQRLEEMLEVALAEGDRALIFTQFAEWGKLLRLYLERQLQRETLFLYGSTPQKQREEMVDRFQNDPQGPRLMILSLKAGGVGLNLTRANHVFHFDRWWNPAVENQATDRVFRIGQTRNVQVHKFVATGTLEEKIHDLIESKKALAEQVVGTGENWLTELDTDQLRNLLLLDRAAVINDET